MRARAILAVAATYGYFLIFAQFGFLHALTETLGEGAAAERGILAMMGVSGMAGCWLTARLGKAAWVRRRLATGFLIAGVAAGLTAGARSPAAFLVAAGLTGLGTAIVTVGLAAALRREIGAHELGPCLGLGTGLAYAVCNLPPVFTARPAEQSVMGVAAAGLGLLAVARFTQSGEPNEPRIPAENTRTIAIWILVLGVLVGFDSAIFQHIQQTPGLQAATWSGSPRLLTIAGAHFLAAMLTGHAVRRRPLGQVVLAGAGLLVAGTGLILPGHGPLGAPVYAAGVSVYSTVLVYYPARQGRLGLAAWVYALAGWLASAVGLGWAAGWR